MSTLFVVLHLLVGAGKHAHWQVAYLRHEAETTSALCAARADRLRADATPGPRERLRIWCRREPDRV